MTNWMIILFCVASVAAIAGCALLCLLTRALRETLAGIMTNTAAMRAEICAMRGEVRDMTAAEQTRAAHRAEILTRIRADQGGDATPPRPGEDGGVDADFGEGRV